MSNWTEDDHPTPEQEREIWAREECHRRGIDPDEVCADGGVEAWMVVARELPGRPLMGKEAMTDEQMADFLGFGNDPRRIQAIQKLPTEKRALFERMATLDTEVELWLAGLGPKPAGVMIDLAKGRRP